VRGRRGGEKRESGDPREMLDRQKRVFVDSMTVYFLNVK
jgi:hypothetical protein